ncbi:MAG: hypothetical protein ACFWTK_10880 [Clostridium sp.]
MERVQQCTLMSYGYNPKIGKWSPFHGALYAIVEAVTKIVASGGDYKNVRLTLQEYFEKLGDDPKKWGKPLSALLGALYAQRKLGIAAIGGKDSMSGTFKDISVPPTLVAFAVNVTNIDNIISPEFKKKGSKVILIKTPKNENDIPDFNELKKNYELVNRLINRKLVLSAYSVKMGGIAEAISKMSFGNKIGFNFSNNIKVEDLFTPDYGSIILEICNKVELKKELNDINYILLGFTQSTRKIKIKDVEIDLETLIEHWERSFRECISN